MGLQDLKKILMKVVSPMVKVCDLIMKLKSAVRYQEVFEEFNYSDFRNIIIESIERLYIDTSRVNEYSDGMFVINPVDNTEYFMAELDIDEKRYVMCCAKLNFYNIVADNYSSMTSFSTDAITVTQGDKPFANLKSQIEEIESERRRLFYKLARFNYDEI